jgi:transcription-repair coupling factor (superfamily II helicase)
VLEELRRENFFRQLNEWKRDGWDIAMVFSNKGEQERFPNSPARTSNATSASPGSRRTDGGLHLPVIKLAVLSSSELFGRYRTPGPPAAARWKKPAPPAPAPRSTKWRRATSSSTTNTDRPKFRGIQQGDDGEELVLEYRDGALLGVPLEQAHLVGKYVGMGGKTPDLNKLGGTAWKNARKAAEKSILDYAAQLLRVQAERQHEPGFAHPPDTKWMWEFERSFHYTETPTSAARSRKPSAISKAPRRWTG